MGNYRKKLKSQKKAIFISDNTYSMFRRSLKNGLKKSVFQKMKKVEILILALGESIRFRERE